MSTQNSNQKIKIISQNYIKPPQNSYQQHPYDNKLPIQQHFQNSHTKISVRSNHDLNNSEPIKPRSSSQFQVPLNPINNTLFDKVYEKSTNKCATKDESLNPQHSTFQKNIRDKEQQSISCQTYVFKTHNVHNNSNNFDQYYQNQPQIDNLKQNISYNTNNQIYQQSYQQPINQQFLQSNQNNKFEFNSQLNGTNSQFNYYNNNQYQIQNYPTENQFIKQQEHNSIVEANIQQKQNQQFKEDDDFEVSEDLTQSITKSISYQCKHCDTRVVHEIIQLDCYHFYHPQCFKDFLYKQIQMKTYRPVKCYCQKKISESQIKNVLQLNQKSDLIDILLKKQISTIFQMYIKIQNLQKCSQCDFFWVADKKDQVQNTYFCQQCEKEYQKNELL